ncbi:MlaD family protein [Pseudonocardia sp. T1-2H]|uniref:MlaD family protein n=1 Tax=Pseudonocardia sp. T1-2H TaxID=3128899 RepID=UPI003101A05C
MILTRFVKTQLGLLVVATLIGSAILGVVFLRLPAFFGIGQYTISAQFTDAARLYDRAEVTYRGRPVGGVQDLSLIDGGVQIAMNIDSSVQIPLGARANARSLSAVGEQYIDIVPDSDSGPSMTPGQVIPMDHTSVPVQIGSVLEQVNALAAALPRDDLNTVINESYDAFKGLGPDLRSIIDNGNRLVTAANQNYEPTAQLLDDLGPLLGTQTEIAPELRSLTADLAEVTDQLRASDPDIRGLLNDGQPFAQEVEGLLTDVQPALPVLLGNVVTVGDVLLTYNGSIQDLLAVYPPLLAATQSIVAPNGTDHRANIDIVTALNDPPPCTTGYLPADQRRDPADTSVAPPPNAYCQLPASHPSAVRGARNLPCAEFPGRRGASPADCRRGGSPVDALDDPPFPRDSAAGQLLSVGRPEAVGSYDPLSGRAIGPDGKPYFLRNVGSTTPPTEDMSWQSLLLRTVGR